MSCIFCKIISKEVSAKIIYEDDNVLAFLDAKPHTKGHSVVIPKTHAVTLFDLEDVSPLFIAVRKVMDILQERLAPDGFNVGWNQQTAGGQVVPHLHVHIMPRYNGDGGGSMHSIINNPSEMTIDEVADLIL